VILDRERHCARIRNRNGSRIRSRICVADVSLTSAAAAGAAARSASGFDHAGIAEPHRRGQRIAVASQHWDRNCK
jgi:hypothetical protein